MILLTAACLPALPAAEISSTGVSISASLTPVNTPALISDEGLSVARTVTVRAASPSPVNTLKPAPTGHTAEVNTVTAIAAAPTVTSYAYLPVVTQTPTPTSGQVIVADHLILSQFESIPKNAIDIAAANKTLFMHQSTGGYIDYSGLGCLAGLEGDPGYGYPQECATYVQNRATNSWPLYDKSNWGWDLWPTPMANAIAKTDQFVDVVHARAGSYQVIGMKYCYVDGWNQSVNVDQSYYINTMLDLERQYPEKTFIWATSALWADPGDACSGNFNSCRQIADFNQQVRAFAHANNKPLYDIADIESHDLNGNPCTVQGYEGMCSVWYSDGGGHPTIAASIRLAKGFWWLMARISGWNGVN